VSPPRQIIPLIDEHASAPEQRRLPSLGFRFAATHRACACWARWAHFTGELRIAVWNTSDKLVSSLDAIQAERDQLLTERQRLQEELQRATEDYVRCASTVRCTGSC